LIKKKFFYRPIVLARGRIPQDIQADTSRSSEASISMPLKIQTFEKKPVHTRYNLEKTDIRILGLQAYESWERQPIDII
jgi:hypothetical protein